MPVYESGYLKNGNLYYVMKELKGGTLHDLITASQLGVIKRPLGELLEIVMKVCDALSYAHSRGVVHRDLKPSNIAVEAGEFWGGSIRNGSGIPWVLPKRKVRPPCGRLPNRTALCC